MLFDRSWYNRAGVERVMGFCSDAEVEEFFRTVPELERMDRVHNPTYLRGPIPKELYVPAVY